LPRGPTTVLPVLPRRPRGPRGPTTVLPRGPGKSESLLSLRRSADTFDLMAVISRPSRRMRALFLVISFAFDVARLSASRTILPVRRVPLCSSDALALFFEISFPSLTRPRVFAFVSEISLLSARLLASRYVFTRVIAFLFPLIIFVFVMMYSRAVRASLEVWLM
jgi:hypothetical protein